MSQFDLVRNLVRSIPKGYVSTYGLVAKHLNLKSPRIVGWALRGNQDSTIPCHRVVQKTGTLATNFSLGGWQEQKRRLQNDGVIFVSERQVDMHKCLFHFTKN